MLYPSLLLEVGGLLPHMLLQVRTNTSAANDRAHHQVCKGGRRACVVRRKVSTPGTATVHRALQHLR